MAAPSSTPPQTTIQEASAANVESEARRQAAEAARANASANGFPSLLEQPIGEGRQLRVICIGAGFAGICAAIMLRDHVKNLDFQLYEKAEDAGGVWHHNRYAGVACDIPAHTYQYTFADNTQWSHFFAPGGEIREYLLKIVDHYKLRPLMKFQHEAVEACWRENEGQWHVKVKNLVSGQVIEDKADFVAYATGLLSKPVWPRIPGRETFKGVVRHSANWDFNKELQEGMDWSDKRVGVIGVGSSAIQIVPELATRAKEVVNFGRTRSVFAPDILAKIGADVMNGSNHRFTEEEKNKLKDPEFYKDFRLMIERDLGSVHFVTHQGSELQDIVRKGVEEKMRTSLATRPEIAKAIIPDFPIGCKRMTPGPGYLDALTRDNVLFVTPDLAGFTEKGIKTITGEEFELDVIICATGFDTSNVPGFPIYGQNGANLQDLWQKEARNYLAIQTPKMPNFFALLGPQSGVGSGNLLIQAEQQVMYMAKALNKVQREGYKSLVVKESAVNAFMRFTDAYFKRTVFTANCKSWYKNGETSSDAKIRTLWPGSSQMAIVALEHPRWEDYDWELKEEFQDEMAWLGDGHIAHDIDPGFYYDHLRAYHKEHPIFT